MKKNTKNKEKPDKFWAVSLDNKTLNSIWDASKHFIQRDKTKYVRKEKHKNKKL